MNKIVAKGEESPVSRRFFFSSVFGAFAALGTASFPAGAVIAGEGRGTERKARQIVSDFLDAWHRRDLDRIAAHVADDIEVVAEPGYPTLKGREKFIADMRQFLASDMGKGMVFPKRSSRVFALSGPAGTAVLSERVVQMTTGGKTASIPLAAAFWVVGDKIRAWYDFPLAASTDG